MREELTAAVRDLKQLTLRDSDALQRLDLASHREKVFGLLLAVGSLVQSEVLTAFADHPARRWNAGELATLTGLDHRTLGLILRRVRQQGGSPMKPVATCSPQARTGECPVVLTRPGVDGG